jgi:nicotinate phosphoribosyltransferase
VASKAARAATVAQGRTLVDFGARRGHGPHSGLLAARAAYIAGFHATSHVEAARLLNVPASGTMAHSWVQSFDSETEAFTAFARAFPDSTTLLIDTYDTLEGARRAAAIDPPVQAVRIDSGDLGSLTRQVRQILDERGRRSVKITASGDLDEYRIAGLLAASAPIDAFGVGTELITSRDAPALSMVYKLVEIDGQGKFKLSPSKKTYPMAKQVDRLRDATGIFRGDVVMRADETAQGEALLVPIVRAGRLINDLPSLETIRRRCADQLAALPTRLKDLNGTPDYPISYSDLLESSADRLMKQGG